MTKPEAERMLRHLFGEWAKEMKIDTSPGSHPSYYVFRDWLDQKGHAQYMRFRSVMGAEYDAEMWFDQHFKLTAWR